MSGPKISVYHLTGHARVLVFEQYRCDRKQIACAEEIRRMLKEISAEGGRLRPSLYLLTTLQERYGGHEARIAEVKELQARLPQELQNLAQEFKTFHPKISRKYRIEDEALKEKQQELKRMLDLEKKVQSLYSEVLNAGSAGEDASAEQTKKTQEVIAEYLKDGSPEEGGPADGIEQDGPVSKETMAKKQRIISENLGGIVSFDWNTGATGEENNQGSTKGSLFSEGQTFEERKEADRAMLQQLLDENARETVYSVLEGNFITCPPDLISEVRAALAGLGRITEKSYLTSFESVTLKRILKRADECLKERCAKEQEYEKQQWEKSKEEEQRRDAEALKQLEMQVIADTVDEVMQEMGYDLIGKREVRKRNGKHFRNELYRFGEGTAVNITYSPEGQISMELGGIAEEDRIPNEAETELLTRDMETFCGEFAEFERRMLERGVVVGNRVALMPPAPEYAAIININDYETEPGAAIEEISVRERRKKADQKVRRQS